MSVDERANQLLMAGLRDEGIREFRSSIADYRANPACDACELARLLVNLTYQLRIDNVTGEYQPNNFAECDTLLIEAEALLESTPERPDDWAWLAWHTAARRLFIVQERWHDASSVDERLLGRLALLDDPDPQVVARIAGWLEVDRSND